MNFQYYETLQDKSKKYLSYIVKQIEPKFTVDELPIFFEDINKKALKIKKGEKSKNFTGYINIGDDYETTADLSKLTDSQLKLLFQIFISREINNKLAVKWRFYQYFKYIRGLVIEGIQVNRTASLDQLVDFIIETHEDKIIYVLCFDTLDAKIYNSAVENINSLSKNEKIKPDRIIFATNKCYRNISVDKSLNINGAEIQPELWVEWIEDDGDFNRDDLLIVNNSVLKLAGFNFTNMEDLLDYIYEFSDGGQITIFKQKEFFNGTSDDEPEVELIWKGIMLKNNN